MGDKFTKRIVSKTMQSHLKEATLCMPVEMILTVLTDVGGSILIVAGTFAWEGNFRSYKKQAEH